MRVGRSWVAIAACLSFGVVLVPPALGARESTRAHLDAARTPASMERQDATLWVIAIGANHHDDPNRALRFADADAVAVAERLRQQRDRAGVGRTRTITLTNERATRARVLETLRALHGRARFDDTVVIFLAGHVLPDAVTGSVAFQLSPSGAGTLPAALSFSDLRAELDPLVHRVRRVVVLADGCGMDPWHTALPSYPPLTARAARQPSDPVFLMAAAPGEPAREYAELGHGAFTYALLEGLAAAADRDEDGLISLSELTAYVALRVPGLTGGAQHPLVRGSTADVPLARGEPGTLAQRRAGPSPLDFRERGPAGTRRRNAIVVTTFGAVRPDAQYDWIGNALRTALTTELDKVRYFEVYSPELFESKISSAHGNAQEAARNLRIDQVVSGSYVVVNGRIRIDARIVRTETGTLGGSESVEGELSGFFALQKELVLKMLEQVRVNLSPLEAASLREQTNTNVDAYRLFLQAEGAITEPPGRDVQQAPQVPPPTPSPKSSSSRRHLWAAALAQEAAPTEETIHAFLDRYRQAHEDKDLDRLAQLYVDFPAAQRAALETYLKNAGELHVELGDVKIVDQRASQVTVFYTRRDRFVDAKTGLPVRLEAKLTKILVRLDGEWKIASTEAER